MPFHELKQILARDISSSLNQLNLKPQDIERELSTPPNHAMGHIALPCFSLAKSAGRPSHELANELAGHLNSKGYVAKSTGPYLNVKWEISQLFKRTIGTILEQKEAYGSDSSGSGQTVVIEYCSPNIAKKLAFHHIRSTLIGNTLSNIYKFLGFRLERINFVGDWGAQFARLLAAFELWGDRERLSESDLAGSMTHLSQIYVRLHKELENHPEYLDLAGEWLKRLENQETQALELWQQIKTISLASMSATLNRLNIEFDHVEGESFYISKIEATLKEVKEKASARLSEGAWIVDIEGLDTPALIQKTDGTTLYLTRDIAAAIDRFERMDFSKMSYVVSSQQKLHFQHLFGVLKKMGYSWSDNCLHLSFGTVLFGSEKMSTRDGNVILLDDILDEAKKLALEECTKKNPDLPNKSEVAEKVGIGAIIFGELSSQKQRDINFEWKHVLALDGETGPYVQYSVVRCHSLLKKAQEKGEKLPESADLPEKYDFSTEEEALLLNLSKFRSTLHSAAEENEPFHLSRYLIDLSKSFNRFYYQLPVLQATDPEHRALRLNFVNATMQCLTNGLNLLGIDTPKEM